MEKSSHTTVRLSKDGDARLRRLAAMERFGSQVAVLEEALSLLERTVTLPESQAPDAVLEKIHNLARSIVSSIDSEWERRTELVERVETPD